jgi:peptide/nickel transport system substrate-binding protein
MPRLVGRHNGSYDGGVALRLVVLALWLAAAAPASARMLVFGLPAEPVQLDPAVVSDGPSLAVTYQVFEGLVRLVGATTQIEPALAERWEVSPDARAWTFHLRPGVRFHDGDPLDGAAVAWNLERWSHTAHPQHANQLRAGQTFEYWDSLFGGPDARSLVARVEAAGPLAVRLTLREPHGPLLSSLAVPGFGIASPRAVSREGTAFGKHPVGTGPFRFVAWRPGQEVVLEANPGYWGPKPALERLVFRSIKDSARRLAALRAGELHGLEGLDPDAAASVRRDPALAVQYRPAGATGYVAFNFQVREFQDRRVREAVARAIQKPALVAALYGDLGAPATQLLPPGFWGHDASLTDPAPDPAGARDLLRQAGLPGGLSTITWADGRREPLVLWYLPVSRGYFPSPKDVAQAIGADLARAGITARLESVDWAVYLERVKHGRLPLYMLGWIADSGDPDTALCYLFCSPGASAQGFYANRAVTDLLLRARAALPTADRAELYRRAAGLLHGDVARLFIVHARTPLVFSRRVTGYVANPTGAESFATVDLR